MMNNYTLITFVSITTIIQQFMAKDLDHDFHLVMHKEHF